LGSDAFLLFSGLEFVEKLDALIPPARVHLTRFLDVLRRTPKSAHSLFPTLFPFLRQPPILLRRRKPRPNDAVRAKRWAELMARVFGLDMQKCVDCVGHP
jgi:hypothetical protein